MVKPGGPRDLFCADLLAELFYRHVVVLVRNHVHGGRGRGRRGLPDPSEIPRGTGAVGVVELLGLHVLYAVYKPLIDAGRLRFYHAGLGRAVGYPLALRLGPKQALPLEHVAVALGFVLKADAAGMRGQGDQRGGQEGQQRYQS